MSSPMGVMILPLLLLALCLALAPTSVEASLHCDRLLGLKKPSDIVTLHIPQESLQAASRQRSRGRPRATDVVSVQTLPGITKDGKDVPQRDLQVTFRGSKRVVVDLASQLQSSLQRNSSSGSTDVGPSQGGKSTLASCNLVPPPFRTLPPFEDTGSLANGVVSLLSWRGDSIASFCSGWLVHPRRVVTAGHCIYNHGTKLFYYQDGTYLIAYTGLNGAGDDDIYYKSAVERVIYNKRFTGVKTWADSLKDGTDTAVLVLATAISGRTYGWAPASSGTARMNLGYPAVSQTGFDQIGDIGPNPSEGPSYGCDPATGGNIICEQLSAEGGQSGGPLFAAYNRDVVVGSLSGGPVGDCPTFFTLALPRVANGVAVTDLLKTSGCKVSTTGGVSRVSRC